MMTKIRTMWGIDLDYLQSCYPQEFVAHLEHQLSHQLPKEWFVINNNNITLTIAGRLYADHIASQLFV
jgi:oxygen-independent coproporphyrinogen-3 oxidase